MTFAMSRVSNGFFACANIAIWLFKCEQFSEKKDATPFLFRTKTTDHLEHSGYCSYRHITYLRILYVFMCFQSHRKHELLSQTTFN
jgi:hypothetical protein